MIPLLARPLRPSGNHTCAMTTKVGWRNAKRAGAEQEGTPGFSQGGPLLPYRRSCERRTYAVGKEQDASGVTSRVRGPRRGIRLVMGSSGPLAWAAPVAPPARALAPAR